MKLLRPLLIVAGVALALGVLLLAAAFNPDVQTWAFRRLLARHPDLHPSVEAVSAGWRSLHLTNLRLERNGATLLVPELDAELPMTAAVREGKFQARRLVAKGWMLTLPGEAPAAPASTGRLLLRDLSSEPTTVAAAAPVPNGPPARLLARDLLALLGRGEQLGDLTLEVVELEGDIVLPGLKSETTARLHATITGGPLAPNQRGTFQMDVVARRPVPGMPVQRLRGQLVLQPSAAGALTAAEFQGTIATPVGAAGELAVSGRIGVEPAGAAAVELAVGPTGTRLLTLAARHVAGSGDLAGTWQLAASDRDAAAFWPDLALAPMTAAGNGHFKTDTSFSAVTADGRLRLNAPAGSGFGWKSAATTPLQADLRFTARHRAGTLSCDALTAMLTSPTTAIAAVRARQPFTIDETSGAIALSRPNLDWLDLSLDALPAAWLPPLNGITLANGVVHARATVRGGDNGFDLRSDGPVTVSHVSVRHAGTALVEDVDISLGLGATFRPGAAWQVDTSAVSVNRGGRELAGFDATFAPLHEAYRQFTLTAKGHANLDAIRAASPLGLSGFKAAETIAGDVSAKVGPLTDLTANLTLTGHDHSHVATSKVVATIEGYQAIGFRVPVHLALGGSESDISIEGTYDGANHKVELDLNSVKTTADHLGLLAAALPISDAVDRTPTPPTRARPFWGEFVGRVAASFYELHVGSHDAHDVRGLLLLTHDQLRLEAVHAVVAADTPAPKRRDPDASEEPPTVVGGDGTLSFHAGAETPYTLAASADFDISARQLLGAAPKDELPIDGRFHIEDRITAAGPTLAALQAGRREDMHVTSKGGVMRILKTTVADALPSNEGNTPVADAVSSAGSALGLIFGMRNKQVFATKNVSPGVDAVLNLARMSSEFRYDELSLTATRRADGALELADIAVTGPTHHLSGTGEIGAASQPFKARPLRLDLQLGFRGTQRDWAAAAGLTAAAPDALGYTPLREKVNFAGTFGSIDAAGWHELLVKAATAAMPAKAAR